VEEDDHDDRHAGQPEDDVAKHWLSPFQVEGAPKRRVVPNSNRAGTELSL
jgi:hypothetical protein